jgi:hypothetical protein
VLGVNVPTVGTYRRTTSTRVQHKRENSLLFWLCFPTILIIKKSGNWYIWKVATFHIFFFIFQVKKKREGVGKLGQQNGVFSLSRVFNSSPLCFVNAHFWIISLLPDVHCWR